MKISIPKRINLEPIVKLSQWSDTYILVKSCNANDIREFTKSQNQVQRQQKMLERKKAIHENSLKNNPDDSNLIDLLNELDDQIEDASFKVFDEMVNFVKARFISGRAYNTETEKIEDLVAEDLSQFNMEILSAVIKEMMGNIEKKA